MTSQRFATPAEEIAYLKKQLEDKQQEVDEVESSFSEFQDFSKQLEEEMEQELKSSEKKYGELLAQHKRLKEEHENTVVWHNCILFLFLCYHQYSLFIANLLHLTLFTPRKHVHISSFLVNTFLLMFTINLKFQHFD